MWTYNNGLWEETTFPVRAVVSTSAGGNMRDGAVREAFCRAHGIDPRQLVTAEQVHGNRVAVVDGRDAGRNIPGADGLVTAERGLALAIFTADCVPVILADRQWAAIGAVHAGWRGLAGGIIAVAVKIFSARFAVTPDRLYAAVGPHIQKCCYRIGAELKEVFGLSADATHLDLSAVAVRQLHDCGITEISVHGHCTCHEAADFFSYRRDKTTHRLMSLVNNG